MNNVNPFYKLAPFIQEFIYKNKWEQLREIQVESCRVIFETDNHLLIASGTASGKTEAAFLPIITDLYNNPSNSVHTLYISPLKALINDQFSRLNDLLEEAYIPVWHWHGDVSQSHKSKLLKNPSGILQITPESLEAVLINKNTSIVSLFGGLKYIVIDEIHSFMGTDRGLQVLCLLSRISEMCGTYPRRIGLSATLGDYKLAEEWLKMGTSREVEICISSGGNRKALIAVEHFKDYKEEKIDEYNDAHYNFIYENTIGKKCIIFTNSRGEAENAIYHLKELSKNNRMRDNYFVHHGSISSVLRDEAENTLKNDDVDAVVAATLTLELGIDIGKLDRILQIGTPFSCSSFVQRLGRSGRRTGKSEMIFVDVESFKDKETPSFLPWSLLQTIAIIELYLKEKWIEPPKEIKYPFGLLYHQTISVLMSCGELSPPMLAKKVLTLPAFRSITTDDFRIVLKYLIQIDHIQTIENGSLIVGIDGEKIANNYHFYAVFNDSIEYKVLNNSKEIGSIQNIPPIESAILLSGKSWIVTDIDLERKVVFVIPSKGKAKNLWNGGIGDIHDRIVSKIKEILISPEDYPYLQHNALLRLHEARDYCVKAHLLDSNIVFLGNNTICVMPWIGSRKIETLLRVFLNIWKKELKIKSASRYGCYYIVINSLFDNKLFLNTLKEICRRPISLLDLINPNEEVMINKFDQYIPRELRCKSYANDFLDAEMIQHIERYLIYVD